MRLQTPDILLCYPLGAEGRRRHLWRHRGGQNYTNEPKLSQQIQGFRFFDMSQISNFAEWYFERSGPIDITSIEEKNLIL